MMSVPMTVALTTNATKRSAILRRGLLLRLTSLPLVLCIVFQIYLVNIPKPSPQEAVADSYETGRHVGDKIMMVSLLRGRTKDPAPPEDLRHGAGGLLRRVHQGHPLSQHLRDDPLQKGIMGAAEHQGVHPLLLEPLEVGPGGKAGHLVVHPPLLSEGDEQGTGTSDHLDLRIHPFYRLGIGTAPDGTFGPDHPHFP